MSDQIKTLFDKLKAQVAEWPSDQKASFIGGISDGLRLAILIANEAGCNLARNSYLGDLVKFLGDQKCPPVKRRNEAAQKPKSSRDQLLDDMRELLRRTIAGRLRISKNTYDTSWDAWDEVNKCLLTVIAITNRRALDDTIADIQIIRSVAGGGPVDRETVKSEVEACEERFPMEIAAIEGFNELSKRRGIKHKDIWIYLTSKTQVILGHDDDELRDIDARYKRVA